MKRFLHHLLFPHESNNYRAKVLHHSSLVFIILLLISISTIFSLGFKSNKSILGISSSITPQELLILINQKRIEKGLSPLSINQELTTAAQRKAEDMFNKNYWAHIAPDGTTPWYFIRSSGYEYVYAGENLARGYTTSSDVVEAWLASPSHRDNMLSANYKDVGFAMKDGTLTGDDTVLVVEIFGSRGTTSPKESPQKTSQSSIKTNNNPLQERSVAALQTNPLINKPSAQKNIALLVIIGVITLLFVDIVITKKKSIVRMLSHNLDHIIFFVMLLLIILLLSRGGIL